MFNSIKKSKKLPQSVIEMDQLNIQGNILDDGWFSHLRYPSGKPHVNAILILSDIVYWYRPTPVKDDFGRLVGHKKKFAGDLLQKSYADLGKRFGLSKKQARDACDFLREKSLIRTELRNMTSKKGTKLVNVQYIEPIVSAIAKITGTQSTGGVNVDTIDKDIDELDLTYDVDNNISSKSYPVTSKTEGCDIEGTLSPPPSHTNTKTTTKTTHTEIYNQSVSQSNNETYDLDQKQTDRPTNQKKKTQITAEQITTQVQTHLQELQDQTLIEGAIDYLLSLRELRTKDAIYSSEAIRRYLSRLSLEMVDSILRKYKTAYATGLTNPAAYLNTLIINTIREWYALNPALPQE